MGLTRIDGHLGDGALKQEAHMNKSNKTELTERGETTTAPPPSLPTPHGKHAAWTDDALQPIQKIEPLRPGIPEELGGMRVTLKSGQSYLVDFTGIDGSSSR